MTVDDALAAASFGTVSLSLCLTVLKLWELARHRHDPLRRLLWLTIAMGASSAASQPLADRVDQLVGLLDAGRLVGNLLTMATLTTGRVFLLLAVERDDPVRGRIRARYLTLVACGAALVTIYAFTPAPYSVDDPYVRDLGYYAAAPLPSRPYLAVYLGYVGWVLPQLGRTCARYARAADEPLTRYGLRTIAAGCFLSIAYVVSKVTNVVVRDRPTVSLVIYRCTFVVFTAAIVLIVVGVVVLSWGRRLGLDRLAEEIQAWRACRRLRPLWGLVSAAVPRVALVTGGSAPMGRSSALFRSRLRLIRMTTEILDGYATLGPRTDQRVAERARAAAARYGLTGERLAAAVEARVVLEAVSAAPGGPGTDPERETVPVPLPAMPVAGTGDAVREVAWFILVARHLPDRAWRGPAPGSASARRPAGSD